MTRLLVTGASGFLGLPCVQAAVARGCEVHALGRSCTAGSPAGVRCHTADLFDHEAVRAAVRHVRPTHLLHLAWVTTPGVYWTSPENRNWLNASNRLLESFADAGGRRAAVAGSCAEYDWTGDGVCHETRTPLQPATLYGQCKAELFRRASAFAAGTGLSFVWPRLFFLYGPREHPARLVPEVARAVLAGRPVACTSGDQRRDFLHAADAADALVSLALGEIDGAINVGSGVAVELKEVVRLTAAAAGDDTLVRLGAKPTPPADPPLLVADVTRLREELGWRPRVPLAAGLAETVDWWRTAGGLCS